MRRQLVSGRDDETPFQIHHTELVKKRLTILLLLCVFALRHPVHATDLSLKATVERAGDLALLTNGRAANILVDPADAEVVRIAADLLASDVERVSGVKPKVISGARAEPPDAAAVVIGTLGKSALIADLVKRGKIDGKRIEGKWESFIVATVTDPFPGTTSALVIAGSDRRGTAYGVFELSERIGVSPWVWWADVAPRHRETLVISAGTHVQEPPSVKYRGIFLNDEDWGLQPWSAKTFEPETGDIGPKTYARICELLLRLKANFLWPAMHDCTKAFNLYPENKVVADRYAIVMGSSHAEPMLRNNVTEWPHDQAKMWNPVTNLPAILEYWEQRVRENGRYENVYTMGMRGVHDSGMPGGGTVDEKRERLEKIVGLQREMLARHVNPNPALVPQIFCPYKEVLTIYQAGMRLPDDITVVWPDDNHSYIRQLPNAEERSRAGGHGIYYHLSYWGRPHDYLWLDSTSPALVWNEMTKAYALDVRQLWVANVGDLKSIETGMTFFLQLAWNIEAYGPDAQRAFLREFYLQQFGAEHADEIAALRDEYYRLCAIRRPEHLGFNGVYPNSPVQNSGWSPEEVSSFLARWQDVAQRASALRAKLPARLHDAYFQLVEYPACGGAAMAEKLLLAEKARQTGSQEFAHEAKAAFSRIQTLTEKYNATANGKWRGIMDYRPRKLPVFDLPPMKADGGPAAQSPASTPAVSSAVYLDPAKFSRSEDRNGAGWRVIEGLGPRGHALVVLPHRDTPTVRSPKRIVTDCPVVEYQADGGKGGPVKLTIEVLPTHRLTPAHDNVVAVSIGDGDPVLVRFDEGIDDEADATWQKNVLRSKMFGTIELRAPAGPYTLKLWAADPAVVVVRLALEPSTGSGSASAEAPAKIVVVGDSTVSEYPLERPDRGWGHYLEEQFRPGSVAVSNLAVPGRSTKTFIKEGVWEKALQLKPAYVFIQFGHNDSHDPKNPESTDAAGDYKDNLRRYVDECRAIGATPILVTPLVRRTFDPQGKFSEAPSGTNRPLGDYARAMREVAVEKRAAIIDLYASSKTFVEQLGATRSTELANRPGDPTHMNEKGARAMVHLVIEPLSEAVPELARLLNPATEMTNTK